MLNLLLFVQVAMSREDRLLRGAHRLPAEKAEEAEEAEDDEHCSRCNGGQSGKTRDFAMVLTTRRPSFAFTRTSHSLQSLAMYLARKDGRKGENIR